MAWFRCMGNGGSPTPDPKYKDISYLKWQLTQTRSDTPAGGYMQITEFYLYLNDEKYEWDSNVSITSNMAGNTGQEVDKIIDSNLNTKYCTQSWGYVKNNECNIIINLGETIRIDGTTTYSFVTGGDEYSRDPVSWKLYCSTDGINWTLLDERIESNVPISRTTETNKYDLERIVKPFTILKGQEYPDSIYGNNGQIYLKYGLVGSLLHFDESVIKDENGHTWGTYASSATLSTEQSKFGGKSLYLNGSDYLQANISDDFNFDSNDFTITCWVYPTTTNRMAVFAMSADLRIGTDIFFGQNSANMWMSSNGSSWNILQSDNSGANTGQGTIPLNANEWTHLAYVRNGTNVRMYVNGQVARDVTLSDINTKVYYNGNNGFRIGSWGNDQYRFVGYIDEFLVCNGVALWTDTFTPPTEPFDLDDFYLITDTYAKKDNTWKSLIGTDVNDINNTSEPDSLINTILDNGQVSTSSAYTTAYFSKDITDNTNDIIIRLRTTIDGTDYEGYKYIKKEELPTANQTINQTISVNIFLHVQVTCTLSRTYIEGHQYSGNYYPIYADIIEIKGGLDALFE